MFENGREVGHAEAAVRHPVEHAVRGGAQKQVEEQKTRRERARRVGGPPQQPEREEREHRGERERMRQSTMPERSAVGDAHPESDRVGIGKDRQKRSRGHGRSRRSERRNEREREGGMRENRGHVGSRETSA